MTRCAHGMRAHIVTTKTADQHVRHNSMECLEVKNCLQTNRGVFVVVLGEKLLQNEQSLRYFCF